MKGNHDRVADHRLGDARPLFLDARRDGLETGAALRLAVGRRTSALASVWDRVCAHHRRDCDIALRRPHPVAGQGAGVCLLRPAGLLPRPALWIVVGGWDGDSYFLPDTTVTSCQACDVEDRRGVDGLLTSGRLGAGHTGMSCRICRSAPMTWHMTVVTQCLQCTLTYCQSCVWGCPRCGFGKGEERR